MFETNIADRNRPHAANRPPMKVVFRSPILSVKIPDTGESRKVVPIVSDPTNAACTNEKQLIKICPYLNTLYADNFN